MKKGDLFPLALSERFPIRKFDTNRNHRIEYIGEKRQPKKGEWYISGAIPEGYHCNVDGISSEYHIGRLVEVETKTVVSKVIE